MADDVVGSDAGEDDMPLIEDIPNSDGMEGEAFPKGRARFDLSPHAYSFSRHAVPSRSTDTSQIQVCTPEQSTDVSTPMEDECSGTYTVRVILQCGCPVQATRTLWSGNININSPPTQDLSGHRTEHVFPVCCLLLCSGVFKTCQRAWARRSCTRTSSRLARTSGE